MAKELGRAYVSHYGHLMHIVWIGIMQIKHAEGNYMGKVNLIYSGKIIMIYIFIAIYIVEALYSAEPSVFIISFQ